MPNTFPCLRQKVAEEDIEMGVDVDVCLSNVDVDD